MQRFWLSSGFTSDSDLPESDEKPYVVSYNINFGDKEDQVDVEKDDEEQVDDVAQFRILISIKRLL